MSSYENDPDLRGTQNEYPYRDYYSTGGDYRPPKRQKRKGGVVIVLALALLLCSGILGQLRDRQETQETAPVTSPAPSQTVSQDTTVVAETLPVSGNVLGSGQQLVISQSSSNELSLQEIYKKVIPSVVSILSTNDQGTSTGTGIIMTSDGYIITNYHVAADGELITVLTHSGEELSAVPVGGDETSDLMVLKVEAQGLTPAEFGDSTLAEVGDSVVAIGDPLGIELRGTMTDGIICGLYRDIKVSDRTMTLMQTNAALNSGNSGGPLVNMMGQVIGINTMKMTSSYTDVEGLGFAIPIATAKPILDELMEKGYVSGRPAFGFTVEELGARVMVYYSLPGRLYIRSVEPDSDAYLKGIRSGDIILAIEGIKCSSLDEFNTVKNQYTAGDELELTIFREGEGEITLSVMLMDRQSYIR